MSNSFLNPQTLSQDLMLNTCLTNFDGEREGEIQPLAQRFSSVKGETDVYAKN